MTALKQGASPSREVARTVEWDCTQLLFRFYYWFDSFRYEEMVALFLPDGVWHRAGKVLRETNAFRGENDQCVGSHHKAQTKSFNLCS